MERIYVAIGVTFWGKGLTEGHAKREALKHRSPGVSKKMNVFRLPQGAHEVYVDEIGTIHWSGPNKKAEVVARGVTR